MGIKPNTKKKRMPGPTGIWAHAIVIAMLYPLNYEPPYVGSKPVPMKGSDETDNGITSVAKMTFYLIKPIAQNSVNNSDDYIFISFPQFT